MDKLELRDALGNCAGRAGKTRRTMFSDEQLRKQSLSLRYRAKSGEPLKNLLVEGVKSIWKSGLTVLIVEQDASLTLNLVERVYILEHGKVGLEGKSRDLMNNDEVKRVYFQLG